MNAGKTQEVFPVTEAVEHESVTERSFRKNV